MEVFSGKLVNVEDGTAVQLTNDTAMAVGLDLSGYVRSSPVSESNDLVISLFTVMGKQSGHWLIPSPDLPTLLNGAQIHTAMLISPGSRIDVGSLSLQYHAQHSVSPGASTSLSSGCLPPPKPRRVHPSHLDSPELRRSSVDEHRHQQGGIFLGSFSDSIELLPNMMPALKRRKPCDDVGPMTPRPPASITHTRIRISLDHRHLNPSVDSQEDQEYQDVSSIHNEPISNSTDTFTAVHGHNDDGDRDTRVGEMEEDEGDYSCSSMSSLPPDLILSTRSSLNGIEEPNIRWPKPRRRLVMPSQGDLYLLEDEKAMEEFLDQMHNPEQLANTATSYVLQTMTKLSAQVAVRDMDVIFQSILEYTNHGDKYLLEFIINYNSHLKDHGDREVLVMDLALVIIKATAGCGGELVSWLIILESLTDREALVQAMVTHKVCPILQGSLALYPNNRPVQQHVCTVLTHIAARQPHWQEKGILREASVDLVSRALSKHKDYRTVVKPALQLLLNLTETYTHLTAEILQQVDLHPNGAMEAALVRSLGILDHIKHKCCHLLPTLQTIHRIDYEILACVHQLLNFLTRDDPNELNVIHAENTRRLSTSSLSRLHHAVTTTLQTTSLNSNNNSRKSSVVQITYSEPADTYLGGRGDTQSVGKANDQVDADPSTWNSCQSNLANTDFDRTLDQDPQHSEPDSNTTITTEGFQNRTLVVPGASPFSQFKQASFHKLPSDGETDEEDSVNADQNLYPGESTQSQGEPGVARFYQTDLDSEVSAGSSMGSNQSINKEENDNYEAEREEYNTLEYKQTNSEQVGGEEEMRTDSISSDNFPRLSESSDSDVSKDSPVLERFVAQEQCADNSDEHGLKLSSCDASGNKKDDLVEKCTGSITVDNASGSWEVIEELKSGSAEVTIHSKQQQQQQHSVDENSSSVSKTMKSYWSKLKSKAKNGFSQKKKTYEIQEHAMKAPQVSEVSAQELHHSYSKPCAPQTSGPITSSVNKETEQGYSDEDYTKETMHVTANNGTEDVIYATGKKVPKAAKSASHESSLECSLSPEETSWSENPMYAHPNYTVHIDGATVDETADDDEAPDETADDDEAPDETADDDDEAPDETADDDDEAPEEEGKGYSDDDGEYYDVAPEAPAHEQHYLSSSPVYDDYEAVGEGTSAGYSLATATSDGSTSRAREHFMDNIYESYEASLESTEGKQSGESVPGHKETKSKWKKFKAVFGGKKKDDSKDNDGRLAKSSSMFNLSLRVHKEQHEKGNLERKKSLSVTSLSSKTKSKWKLFGKKKSKDTDVKDEEVVKESTGESDERHEEQHDEYDVYEEATYASVEDVDVTRQVESTEGKVTLHQNASSCSLFDTFYEQDKKMYRGKSKSRKSVLSTTSTIIPSTPSCPSLETAYEDVPDSDNKPKRSYSWLRRTRLSIDEDDADSVARPVRRRKQSNADNSGDEETARRASICSRTSQCKDDNILNENDNYDGDALKKDDTVRKPEQTGQSIAKPPEPEQANDMLDKVDMWNSSTEQQQMLPDVELWEENESYEAVEDTQRRRTNISERLRNSTQGTTDITKPGNALSAGTSYYEDNTKHKDFGSPGDSSDKEDDDQPTLCEQDEQSDDEEAEFRVSITGSEGSSLDAWRPNSSDLHLSDSDDEEYGVRLEESDGVSSDEENQHTRSWKHVMMELEVKHAGFDT